MGLAVHRAERAHELYGVILVTAKADGPPEPYEAHAHLYRPVLGRRVGDGKAGRQDDVGAMLLHPMHHRLDVALLYVTHVQQGLCRLPDGVSPISAIDVEADVAWREQLMQIRGDELVLQVLGLTEVSPDLDANRVQEVGVLRHAVGYDGLDPVQQALRAELVKIGGRHADA